VRSTANLLDDLTVVEAPARLFAVFPFEEHVSRLGETVNAIWERWLPSSDYEKDIVPGAPDLVERYGLGFDPATGKGDITIWIPIKPLPN
jgi:predicted transcriptional regulator YdeE